MERHVVLRLVRFAVKRTAHRYRGGGYARPKYYDMMVRDWLFWMDLARELRSEVHILRAESTPEQTERRTESQVGEHCEAVVCALGVVRRERDCAALEWAIRGKTVRQIQIILRGRSALSISEELDWACNRLITLAKEALDGLELTLQ